MRSATLLAGLIGMLAHAGTVGAMEPIEARVKPLIDGHKGEVAVAIKNLKTGETYLFRADVPMPTASLIKLPVMVEAYRQAEAKQIDLASKVTLHEADKVPGAGVLTHHFSDGATFPLIDAVHLMIAFSDNTATNFVLDAIGIPSTAKTMEKLGYPNTKIHSKVYRRDTSAFPERSKRFGLGSTTANEMIRLCQAIHEEKVVSPEASKAMLKHMRACDDKDKFPRFLPAETPIAFKTGSVDDIRTAAGIIETPKGPVALCVLTEKNQDERYASDNAGDLLCAVIAREVFQYFSPAQEKSTP